MVDLKKFKRSFNIIFILIYIFTIFGIFQISKGGGPCNGGLLFLIFLPLFLITSLFLILSQFYFFRKNRSQKSSFFALISFLIWSFGIVFFYDSIKIIIYLGPFEILIFTWLFCILLYFRTQNNIKHKI